MVSKELSSDDEDARVAENQPAARRARPGRVRYDPARFKLTPPADQDVEASPPAPSPARPGRVRYDPARFKLTPPADQDVEASPAVRPINLARFHVTDVKEQGNIETLLEEERKTYPNNSKVATLTKEVSISYSVARTVTIESNDLKVNSAGVGITFFGFAAIQGQIQQQLNQRYSITTQNSITISEKTSIQVPPDSTVEHIIRWKLVSLRGIAVLGETPRPSPSFDLAEVPYQVPLRLTYTEVLNDVLRNEEKRD